MADGTTLNLGSGGDVIATDDIGGTKYQIVKFTFGALDSQTIASSGTGTDDAGTQRVTLATDITLPTGPVTNAGTFVVQENGAALTALQLIDDVVVTLGTDTYTETTTKANVIGAVRNDSNGTLVDTDNEIAPLQVNADGALYTHSPNTISSDNSTTSTLIADAVYTGTGQDVSQCSVVTITLDSSHDSATDGMTFEFSTDNSNWDDVYSFTYTAANGARRFQFPVTAQYFRIVYTNGGTGQTHFRVQTIAHDNATLTTVHRLVEAVHPDRSAQVMKTAIIAQAAGSGDFIPVQVTAGGNFKVSVEEISDGLDIGAGNAGSETQRVSISTDDVNLASINTDAGTIAGAVAGTEMQVDVLTSALPTGAATSAAQLPDGHAVTVDNGAAGAAVNIQDGGNSITIDGAVTADLGSNNDVTVTGGNAHDGVTLGNPVLGGARATNSVEGLTQVANADLTYLQSDLNGVLLSRNGTTLEELISGRQTNTDGSEDAMTNFAAGAAGVHNYITSVTIANSHASTNGTVDLVDGTGGTVMWTFPAPAGGGATHNFDPPLKQATAATGLFFDPSAAITTIIVSINGYQAQG